MTTGLDLIISTICNATFCNTIYDNPFLDALLSKKQMELMALTKDINGKHLKIATYNNYPLSWSVTHENGTVTGHGVAFAIVDILREKFNFTFEVVVPTYNYEVGGKKSEDSLIGLVNSSSVDMAAAFLPNIDKYRKKVTFSKDIDEGVWMMMLKRPKESAAGSGLLAPFETSVWFLTLVAVLSFGPCITVLTYIRSKFVKTDEKIITLSPSFWFVYGAFIKQGTTLSPEAICGWYYQCKVGTRVVGCCAHVAAVLWYLCRILRYSEEKKSQMVNYSEYNFEHATSQWSDNNSENSG